MNPITFLVISLIIFGFLYFLVFAAPKECNLRCMVKNTGIPTIAFTALLALLLYLDYLDKPTGAGITGWSPLGISLLVLFPYYIVWIPLSLWMVNKSSFNIFQRKYNLSRSDFRDFSNMNVFNKKRKIEKWEDKNSMKAFDYKK